MKKAQDGKEKTRFIPLGILIPWILALIIEFLFFEIGDLAVFLLIFLALISMIFAIAMLFQSKYSAGQKIVALFLAASIIAVQSSPIHFLYENARFAVLKPAYNSCAEEIADEITSVGEAKIGQGEYTLAFPRLLLSRAWGTATYTYDGDDIAIGFTAFNSLNDWGSYVYLSDGDAENWFRVYEPGDKHTPKDGDGEYTLACQSYEPRGDKWFYVVWG